MSDLYNNGNDLDDMRKELELLKNNSIDESVFDNESSTDYTPLENTQTSAPIINGNIPNIQSDNKTNIVQPSLPEDDIDIIDTITTYSTNVYNDIISTIKNGIKSIDFNNKQTRFKILIVIIILIFLICWVLRLYFIEHDELYGIWQITDRYKNKYSLSQANLLSLSKNDFNQSILCIISDDLQIKGAYIVGSIVKDSSSGTIQEYKMEIMKNDTPTLLHIKHDKDTDIIGVYIYNIHSHEKEPVCEYKKDKEYSKEMTLNIEHRKKKNKKE